MNKKQKTKNEQYQIVAKKIRGEGSTLEDITSEISKFPKVNIKKIEDYINLTKKFKKEEENEKRIKQRKELSKILYHDNSFQIEKNQINQLLISDIKSHHSNQYHGIDGSVIIKMDHTDHIGFHHSICEKQMYVEIENCNFGETIQYIKLKCDYCDTGWMNWRKANPNINL